MSPADGQFVDPTSRDRGPVISGEPVERSKDFVKSLERGLAVIRAMGSSNDPMTLSEVAARAGIPRAAARRFLITLSELSYVESDGRLFRLTPRVMELGYGYLSGLSLPDIAIPHAEWLVNETKQPSEGAILDGDEIVYVFRVPGPYIMSSNVNVGARMPAHATALGKMLLAGLSDDRLDELLKKIKFESYTERTVTDPARLKEDIERIRELGYSLVDQELEPGLCAIAVPIKTRKEDEPVAINVSSSIVHHTPESMVEEILPPLRTAADQIAADLASTGA
ncbi:MAG: helix-turn-helix domain-containing protein [Solirubrobacterales bacterium]|nr:helix-turn-helix domain-containing protein [Solirubrobacterales bacterium]